GARLEPIESSASNFIALLDRGSASFDVQPGGPRHWQIECGLATVEVVGTRFSCARSPDRLHVGVERGVVLVRGERVPSRARRLSAGESLDVYEPTVAPEAAENTVAPGAAGAAPAGVEPQAAVVGEPAAAARTTGQGWRELARSGRHREAFASLGLQGFRREV